MITKTNLESLLIAMGFVKNGNVYEKHFAAFDCALKVDFANKKLIYPVAIKGRERNGGFDQPENFVVFECVNRLLEKGYRPEHIELEKVWQLGHEQKGGRADICISDSDGSMLVIIECKTYGKEFDKYYKKTIADGDQLFSYWQQERAIKWLVLYASDLSDDGIIYKAPTINCTDYKSVLESAKKDKTILSYQEAYTKEQLFEVWKETYACKFYDDLVFSSDSRAYKIGVKPLLKKDLHDFTPDDKIVNKFEEILRHNNVSDKENAFNRLVALFICKLVDESKKGEDDEVEFQYKQGTDTYETLQDRLQRLHTEGMQEFMREKIFYVSNDYPEWLFTTYTGHQRQKAIEDLKEKIRILKFYSNNDFSFKDVHNEELFYQNGKILVEVVQLFEQYRIVYPSKHQFLGDLFEQLLNKGFKQNEGQFFTPMPITRFIWDCLPVERMTHSEKGIIYPKVIDYACGAGHFLTEAVEAINAFVDNGGDNSWVRDHIYGIEKDYRLARVSKISLFMNGAGGGNIIFGDGLENAPDKQIENNSFDVLVANPPYSVKDFKQHLQLKNNSFELIDRIGENGSEIEVLFVERIAQLLKPKGIAAVILPSSILSNDSASYMGAREQLLQNFYIRAIVQLGSQTFGATGTNTVVLFLEKYDEPPKKKDLVTDSVNAILSGEDITEWKDRDIYESYLAQIEVSEEDYAPFIKEGLALEELAEGEYFKMYIDAFNASTEIKNLRKLKTFQRKTVDEQAAEIRQRFYKYAKSIEFEKLFYFALTYEQQTVIITAPADNAAQKEFLGYEWSNRKGAEGIQIKTPGGKMFDSSNRTSDNTLAFTVRQSFSGTVPALSDATIIYAGVVQTCDTMDFSRASYNKSIRTSVKKPIQIHSKYPVVKLSSVVDIISGGTPDTKIPEYWDGDIPWLSVADFNKNVRFVCEAEKHITEAGLSNSSTQYLYEGDIIISARGTVGVVAQVSSPVTFNQSCYGLRAKATVDKGYLYYALYGEREHIESLATGMKFPSIVRNTFDEIKIPLPPLEIQQQIVADCEKIDDEYNTTRMSIEEYRKKIADLFNKMEVISSGGGYRLTLSDKAKFVVSIGQRVLTSELVSDGTIPVFSANVFEPFGYVNKLLIEDFSSDSILWGIDGDWMVNYYAKEQPFYPTDHCGVLRILTDEVNPRYMAHVLEKEGRKMNFSRSYRASIDRVEGITFTVPGIEVQNDAMDKVLELEQKITEAEKQLADIATKKADVLKKYL